MVSSDCSQIGTGSSNSPRSATHVWTPPVSRVKLLTRFGTRLQSYIRPACRASDEARALMDFRALRSLSVLRPRGPCLATECGSAGPTGSPSASHNAPYATSARAVFNCPHSLCAHAVLRSGSPPAVKRARSAKLRAWLRWSSGNGHLWRAAPTVPAHSYWPVRLPPH